MRTWHCLLCGLDFGLRTELEWHIREDHRPLHQEVPPGTGIYRSVSARDWTQLHELQRVVEHPAVSLLLGTSTSPRMAPLDVARLRLLAGRALCRLVQQIQGQELHDIAQRLAQTVARAEKAPTDAGLAVFVSLQRQVVVPLPFRPRDRVVVDSTFATRDLLDALQRFPRYRVLALSGAGFRVLEGRARHLREVAAWHAPSSFPEWLQPHQGLSQAQAVTHISLHDRPDAVLVAADRALTRRVRHEGALPLVVAGQHRLIERFMQSSDHAASVVGEIAVPGLNASTRAIAERAERVINARCAQEEAKQLSALAQADEGGQVAWGLDEVWQALRAGLIEHLWVERDYSVGAGALGPGAGRLLLASPARAPRLTEDSSGTDDVVDEIVDLVTAEGAPVELVDHLAASQLGAGYPTTGHEGHIAAQLRQAVEHHA